MGKYAKAIIAFAGSYLTALAAQLANNVPLVPALLYSLLPAIGVGGVTYTVPNKANTGTPPSK